MADPLLLLPERDVLRQIALSRAGSAPAPQCLVQLHSSFATPFAVCLAMELVEGASFWLRFEAVWGSGAHLGEHLKQGFTLEQASFYTAELLLALSWLHENHWLYRDLKLANVTGRELEFEPFSSYFRL